MDRQQILDLYDWSDGTCFRHPGRGVTGTALVKEIHPPGDGCHEIRACRDCVMTMEDIRREEAARAGGEYVPGQVAESVQRDGCGSSGGVPTPPTRGESGEL